MAGGCAVGRYEFSSFRHVIVTGKTEKSDSSKSEDEGDREEDEEDVEEEGEDEEEEREDEEGEEEEGEDEDEAGPVDWSIDPKTSGRRDRTKLYGTEEYRSEEVTENQFAKTNFKKDTKAVEEAARLIQEDNFERYHLGLVIPLNAAANYEG
jgi:hypothetical protein